MPKTVMIVDDSNTMRQMLSDTLTDAGFSVIQGVNGAEALKTIDGHPVELVITDFNMPVMGGVELIRNLRAKAEYKHTPILMLTTEYEDSRKDEGKKAGATGWMVKPFDPVRLVQVVTRLIP
jgi:two-component system chemotaxis response regulator CheY